MVTAGVYFLLNPGSVRAGGESVELLSTLERLNVPDGADLSAVWTMFSQCFISSNTADKKLHLGPGIDLAARAETTHRLYRSRIHSPGAALRPKRKSSAQRGKCVLLILRVCVPQGVCSVFGVFDPVPNHPLLAGASLHHQPQTEVRVFGHFHLQTAARIPAYDWTVLCEIPQPLRRSRHSVAFLQAGCAAPAVIHQAFGIREEGGGPQGPELQETLCGIPG